VFNLRLQNPADEITIQKSLKDARYSEEDVVSLSPVNQPAKEYLVNVTGLEDVKKRLQLIGAVGDCFKNNLVYHDVRMKLGDITETLQTQDISLKTSQPFIDVEVSESIEPTVLNLELDKLGFSNVTVTKQSQETERTRASKLRIEGPRTSLQDIKQTVKETVSIPSVYNIGNEAIHVELKEGISKENFVALIGGIKLAALNFCEIVIIFYLYTSRR